ncbi:MAG: MFS transporter [Betaproteobacteria bacterium]|nr:MFS transporter [Rhodocyclaceae bacterium]MCA3133475.1 MFS transporter [Rhodocyclaceae bacterium]MCA3141409.1 MFS transporter [Rhodocyclaceae bacterium]MCA3145740.1 MFS transporter [Rhodocyclaceae bacterium]MCE2897990.1 MFS transporter [Betaproteobacteria bacterium]
MSHDGTAPRRALLLLACAGFVSGASMRVAEPLLPTLAREFGAGVREASVVLAAFSVAYGSFQIVHGPLGDRVGKLRLATAAMLLAAVAAMACAAASSIEALSALRFATGMFSGAIIPLSLAWIGDHVDYAHRQAVLGRFVAGTLLGQSFGPLLGGTLSDLAGWHATFVALGAAFLLVGFALAADARHDRGKTSGAPVAAWRQYLAILRSPRARPVLFTVGVEGFLFFGALGFVGAYAHQRFGLSDTATGVLVAGFGVGGVAYSLLVRQLVGRLGEAGLVVAGGVTLLGCFLALACMPLLAVAATAVGVMGLGFYMLHNTLQTRATEMAPDARGAGVSFFALCLFLGQAAGVSTFGLMVERFGYRWPFVAAGAGLAALAWWFSARLMALRSRPPAGYG